MRADVKRQTADRMAVSADSLGTLRDAIRHDGIVRARAYDYEGNLKWEEAWDWNLVTNEGEAHFLDVGVHAASQISTWYVGLFGALATAGTLAETDTLGSWSSTGVAEQTASYSEANRVAFVEGAVATGATPSVSNTGTPASFSITGAITVGGAFLASTNVKAATAGILLAEKAFTGGDRTLSSGDTLKIEYTLQAAGS